MSDEEKTEPQNRSPAEDDALKDTDIKSGEEAAKRPAEGSTGDTGDGTGEGSTGQASDGVPAEKAAD